MAGELVGIMGIVVAGITVGIFIGMVVGAMV
jgi:hypothetical protein